ncbi:hypothetical protein QOL99_09585 [Deinococcus sp. MIMF12]|uniref:Uncharacterized protein n=1 Tax=Deinococcus rhizophilus TaxID=3049544 RepID=A0ABT7JIU9_9DEIO|nr:hypothetical protein [Deinococcus rhizophilus]MDL2344405.1 hypothetical protein [Deinococcus rhizophilus]
MTAALTPRWTYYLSSAATLLKETLSFAVTLGLLESTQERAWDDRTFTTAFAPDRLRATVLHLLTRQADVPQQAFRGVHDTLVEQGKLHTAVQEVLELMETSAYGRAFRWNDTKVNFWSQFAHDLGLVIRMPPERLVLSPSTALLLELLPDEGGPLRPLLEHWHREYCAVFTRLGEVHEGFARALLRLEVQGYLTLSYASDTVGTVLLCGRRVSHCTLHAPQEGRHVDPL